VSVNGELDELQPVDELVTVKLKSYVPAVRPEEGMVIEIGELPKLELEIGAKPVRALVLAVKEY
jgi:hypothetical protein